MSIEPLLALMHAPNLNAVPYEPLHDKWRLVILSAQPIEHEYEKYIEFVSNRHLLKLNDGISILGRLLEARDTLLIELLDDIPIVLLRCEIPATGLLHRDVILLHLSDGGYPV